MSRAKAGHRGAVMIAGAESVRRTLRDLRTLSAAELWHRAGARVSRAAGLHARRFPPGPLSDGAVRTALEAGAADSPRRWREHLLSRSSRFLFHPSRRAQFRRALAGFPADPRGAALLDGASLLYGEPVHIAAGRHWHTDPMSGHRWPETTHWAELQIHREGGADVRHVWELSRHRDLFVVGREYWRTGDERYAAAAAALLDSWIESNPPELGVNWWSNLEIAVRSVAWICALHWFLDSPTFRDTLIWRMTGTLLSSARHLDRHLPFSIACMPGNHVIGDAAGLAAIALTFPEFREATAWRRTALSLLERESRAQVGPDGVHVEGVPAYHAFVFELLYLAGTLARLNGLAAPAVTAAAMEMVRPLVTLQRPDGSLPPIGDADEGVGFDFCSPGDRVRAIAALGAVETGDGALKAIAGTAMETLLWIHGPEFPVRWASIDAAVPPRVHGSAFGAVSRSGWQPTADAVLLRGGGQSRHTHADALHLEISVSGVSMFEDSGTFTYTGDAAVRHELRGTAAHNTLVIDGRDQALQHRTMRWVSPLGVRCRAPEAAGASTHLSGEHSGYRRIGVSHRRQVCWIHGAGWLVLDRVCGRGVHEVAAHWHTRGRIRRSGEACSVERAGVEIRLAAAVSSGQALSWDIRPARMSPRYGKLVNGTDLSCRIVTELPVTLVTWITPLPEPLALAIAASDRADVITAGADGLVFRVRFAEDTITVAGTADAS